MNRAIYIGVAVYVVSAATGLTAKTYRFGPLPASEYADTVVSTNVLFNRSRSDVRNLDVSFQFHGSVSNAVEVAFGCDRDQDGDLSGDETDVVLGWRGGAYCLEDVVGVGRIVEAATNEVEGSRYLNLSVRTDERQVPLSFSATSDEGPRFCQFAACAPSWGYGSEWNAFKVVKRGTVESSEVCTVQVGYERFVIRLR